MHNEGIDWDDRLPPELIQVWTEHFKDIEGLKSVEFPRCLKLQEATGNPDLQVLSDASNNAYGAVADNLWNTPVGQDVQLVSAKARVITLFQD